MERRARVLVADDDPDLLDLVVSAVRDHGLDAVRAESGADLIQHLAEELPVDLIITDVSMPWMSGLQVAHAARSAGLRTPVIVMTAMRHAAVAAQVAALGGAVLLLRKPFELSELHAAIASMLERDPAAPVQRR